MNVKTVKTEWFQDYVVPSMFIAVNQCHWKCDKECGQQVCQNSALASAPTIDINTKTVIEQYLRNPITSAIVFGGLEPMEQFPEILSFIRTLRDEYHCGDTVVIYTGYYKTEISSQIEELKQFKNIVVKYGRYIPDQEKHFDEILGVFLASPNQYAERIS